MKTKMIKEKVNQKWFIHKVEINSVTNDLINEGGNDGSCK